MMTDLFGNEGRAPSASLSPCSEPASIDLFTAMAEARALCTGRPVSQERIELLHPETKARDDA